MLILLLYLPVSGQTDNEQQLWDAATKNDVNTLKVLLDKGVNVNAKTHYGTTALTFAAYRGNLEAVNLLLERGADPNTRDSFYGATPFLIAFDKKNADILKAMILHGANLSSGDELQEATELGLTEIVNLMLDKGAKGADKALMIAAKTGNTEIINVILKSSPVSQTVLTNALITAMDAERKEAVAALKLAGAKVPEKMPGFNAKGIIKGIKGSYANKEESKLEIDYKDSVYTASFEGNPPETLKLANDTSLVFINYPDIRLSWKEIEGRIVSIRIIQPGGQTSQFFRIEEQVKIEDGKEMKNRLIDKTGLIEMALNWPSFRGNYGNGLADGQFPPTYWNAAKGKNLMWKTYIPGLAHSSPVIWGDKIFITTAMSSDTSAEYRVGLFGDVEPAKDNSSHVWKIYCLDKMTGKILWEKKAYEGVPRVKRHVKGSQANATPVTNGRFLVAVFGSEGMVCYDLKGNELWRKDLGVLDAGWFYEGATQWGPASSPVIYKNLVILQCDRNKDSYIAAWDLKTGSEVWNSKRDEISSWGTPALYYGKAHDELITNSSHFIRGYNPGTGEELWRLAPNSEVTVGSPVVADSLIFVTAGYPPVQPVYAIKEGGSGNISIPDSLNSGKFIMWRTKRGGTYMPTPIVYNGYLYTLANQGVVTCYDVLTGQKKYRESIANGKAFTASPVAADGKLYFTSEENGVVVVKAGPAFEIVSNNQVGEICMATPAISGGMIFIRAQHHVFCFARKK
jgi:outer membrane protein assembly factor BamB